MALQNPKLFGYEIAAAFTDVSDASLALRRLNIAPFDLEVLRGSANAGMIPNDWRSFSRLSVPLVRTTDRYKNETGLYVNLINNRAGTNSVLFGNLDVNGSISGKAIRYNYVDFSDSNKVKIADISTSRVSAWSSSDSRSTNNDLNIQQHASISYGAQVGIATAGGTIDANFQSNGDLLLTGAGAANLSFAFSYNDAPGDGKALGTYSLSQLNVSFTQGSSQTGSDSATANSIVPGNYTATILNGNAAGFTVEDDGKKLCFKDSSGSDCNAEVVVTVGAQVVPPPAASLVFGTQGSAKTVDGVTYNDCLGPRLQTSMVPLKKEFNSETPTHKVKVKLGTTDVWLYAMKGIPYSVKGFFRNVNAEIKLTTLKNGIAGSWKVVETGNSNSYVNFADIGGTTSSIAFRSPVSRERFIQFYYDPDYIKQLQIQSANISEIPQIRLANATTFDLYNNQVKNLPDFNFLTPSLTSINLHRNPLYLSETEAERFLNPTTIAKFPSTITNFQMGGTWYGSIRGQTTGSESTSGDGTYTSKDLIVRRFNNLVNMNLYRNGGGYFYPDNIVSTVLPNIPETCTYFNIGNNDFRSIGASRSSEHSGTYPNVTYGNSHFSKGSYSIEDAPALQTLDLYNNYYLTDASFTIASDAIATINMHNTGLPIPNCQGKDFLTSISATWCRNAYSLFANAGTDANAKNVMSGYKFEGCGALTNLNFNYGNLKNDRFPKFTNSSLTSLYLYETQIKGGTPAGSETNVIAEDTFEQCTNLSTLQIRSGNLLTASIHQYAFIKCAALNYFYYYSYGRTGGNLPDFTANGNLRTLQMMGNNFSGGIPTFAGSPSIYYINLSNNSLTGGIPSFANLTSLTYLYLYNNNFTSLGTFTGLGSLYRFEAHNNDIGGTIPDFTACGNLYYLILFNNKFNSYTSGSFADLRRIKYIDLANNDLSQQAVNSIVADMYLNYQTYGSGRRITVNLRGNSTPGEEAIETILLLRASGWTITFT